jgi:hypothetical protein
MLLWLVRMTHRLLAPEQPSGKFRFRIETAAREAHHICAPVTMKRSTPPPTRNAPIQRRRMRMVRTSGLGPAYGLVIWSVAYCPELAKSAICRARRTKAAPSPQSSAPTPTLVQINSGSTEFLVSQHHALYLATGRCGHSACIQELSKRGLSQCSPGQGVSKGTQLVGVGRDAPITQDCAKIPYRLADLYFGLNSNKPRPGKGWIEDSLTSRS